MLGLLAYTTAIAPDDCTRDASRNLVPLAMYGVFAVEFSRLLPPRMARAVHRLLALGACAVLARAVGAHDT